MVTWTQMYMPMGGLGLSALVALIPIIFFFVALAVLRLKGHVAGAITLILYREVNYLILVKNPGGKWIKRDLMG